MNIYERCIEILYNRKDYRLRLTDLYKAYATKYGSSFLNSPELLQQWLESSKIYFSFTKFNYFFCRLIEGYNPPINKTAVAAMNVLQNHHNQYTLSILLSKLKENDQVDSTLTDEELFTILNSYPIFKLEERSLVLCELTDEGIKKAKQIEKDKTHNYSNYIILERKALKKNEGLREEKTLAKPYLSSSSTYNLENESDKKKLVSIHISISQSTTLTELSEKNLISYEDYKMCERKNIKTLRGVQHELKLYRSGMYRSYEPIIRSLIRIEASIKKYQDKERKESAVEKKIEEIQEQKVALNNSNSDERSVRLTTKLNDLVKWGYLSEKENSHCKKRYLYTVSNVKTFIEARHLTPESKTLTKYTLDILFKIINLLPDNKKPGYNTSIKSTQIKGSIYSFSPSNNNNKKHKSTNISTQIDYGLQTEVINEDEFIRTYFTEHNSMPLWYELYNAILRLQKATYHLSFEKALIRMDEFPIARKKELIKVRDTYQLHKEFYFYDDQPLSSWRSEQLDDNVTASMFLHCVATVFKYEVITLEHDEVMIKPSYSRFVKPLVREIKRCISSYAGSNALIMIDELFTFEHEEEQENVLKQFSIAWLKRKYRIDASGDSFWI